MFTDAANGAHDVLVWDLAHLLEEDDLVEAIVAELLQLATDFIRITDGHHRMIFQLLVAEIVGVLAQVKQLAQVLVGVQVVFGHQRLEQLGDVVQEPPRAIDADCLFFFAF